MSLLGCTRSESNVASLQKESGDEKSSLSGNRDYGPILQSLNCQAPVRRELSVSDKCVIDSLKKNCTRAADCMVTCISSPDGERVGGGCFHICFSDATGISWKDRPNIDYKECDELLRKELENSRNAG
jgi:hypothetical protein